MLLNSGGHEDSAASSVFAFINKIPYALISFIHLSAFSPRAYPSGLVIDIALEGDWIPYGVRIHTYWYEYSLHTHIRDHNA